jgi:ribonuclease HII
VPRPAARRTLENAVRRQGFERVAGVDEVGRGCLAGPVVAAAVVLDPGRPVRGLRDSKLLTPAARERLYAEVVARAATWALAAVGPGEIDRIDIHRASLQAMRDAVAALAPAADFVLVDGFPIPDLPVGQHAVRGGDRRCAAIAAASIVAKVTRDRQMRRLHLADPRYGFDRHKGYATERHLAALRRFGYSPAHRRSFRPRSLFDRIG